MSRVSGASARSSETREGSTRGGSGAGGDLLKSASSSRKPKGLVRGRSVARRSPSTRRPIGARVDENGRTRPSPTPTPRARLLAARAARSALPRGWPARRASHGGGIAARGAELAPRGSCPGPRPPVREPSVWDATSFRRPPLRSRRGGEGRSGHARRVRARRRPGRPDASRRSGACASSRGVASRWRRLRLQSRTTPVVAAHGGGGPPDAARRGHARRRHARHGVPATGALALALALAEPRDARLGLRDAGSGTRTSWVEEIEPGVFITIARDGTTGHEVLRRVRFSKRMFGDTEAT